MFLKINRNSSFRLCLFTFSIPFSIMCCPLKPKKNPGKVFTWVVLHIFRKLLQNSSGSIKDSKNFWGGRSDPHYLLPPPNAISGSSTGMEKFGQKWAAPLKICPPLRLCEQLIAPLVWAAILPNLAQLIAANYCYFRLLQSINAV